MIKVIIPGNGSKTIDVNDITKGEPIFAIKNGKLCGLIVKEEEGYILRMGESRGSNGHHETIKGLILSNYEYGYEFFIEE